MLRHISTLGFTAALVSVGCTDGGPTVPGPGVQAAAASLHASPPVRPWEAVSSGGSWVAGTCADGSGLAVTVQGEGLGRHVGRFTVELTGCLDPATGMPLGLPTGTITAASGAEIHITMTGGYVDEETGESVGSYVAAGGTGRFAQAAGEFTNRGTTDPVTGEWSNTSTGWISY